MLVLLLLIVVLMTFLNFAIAKMDVFAPAPIACASLSVGLFFCYLGADSWNLELSSKTFFVILFGVGTITVANILAGKRFKVPISWIKQADVFYKDRFVVWATLFSVVFTILYGIDAYRVGIMAGGNGLNAFAYMKTIYMQDSDAVRMNPIIRQLFKPVIAIAYVNMFLLIDTIVKRKKDPRRKICGIISILSATMIVIFSGSRTEIMQLLSGGILMFSVLWRERRGWKLRDNKRSLFEIIRKVWPFILVFIILAFISRNVVKTTNNELSATSTFFQYLIFYIGSSVAVLDRKLEIAFDRSGFLLGNKTAESIMHGQVYLGNLNYGGNTATIFISVFDGGLLHMVIRLLFVFIVGSILYRSILLKTESSYKRGRNLIIMSMMYYVFTMAYYSDCAGLVIKISNLLTMVFVLFYYKLIAYIPAKKVNKKGE